MRTLVDVSKTKLFIATRVAYRKRFKAVDGPESCGVAQWIVWQE